MKALLQARRIPWRRDLRRVIVVALVLLAAAPVWRLIRAPLRDHLARSSLGCERRGRLIGAALAARYPEHAPQLGGAGGFLRSWRRSDLCGAHWQYAPPDKPLGPTAGHAFCDENLVLHGRVAAPSAVPYYFRCGDWDGDGRMEVALNVPTCRELSSVSLGYMAVVRLGKDANEVVVLSLLCSPPRYYVQEFDGSEARTPVGWVLQGYTYPGTGGTPQKGPRAVFRWDRPGGILVPYELPEDGSVLVWTPPGGVPLTVPADQPIEPLLEELLPVPEGFGRPGTPASGPASVPATSGTGAM
ncbi:MAG: hypothetical protein AB1716_23470 [Planctomycetota bacterium]